MLERNMFKRDTDLGFVNEVLTILEFSFTDFHKLVDLCCEYGLGIILPLKYFIFSTSNKL